MGEVKEKFTHGEPIKLCDSVFLFHQPEGPAQLEVVFVHGLVDDNWEDAYWKTWLARDGTPNNVWPMTWLPAEFPFAQVYALKYDASIKQTATDGRMDLFLVGENLVQEMVIFGQIGQNGVPVVFVCHGFGGLVAKQIVVSAKSRFSQDIKAQNLLQNIRGFCFYSTPHRGLVLAKYLHNGKSGRKGPLLENMEVLNTERSRLSEAFEKAKLPSWYFASAAETHASSQLSNYVFALVSSCLRMFLFHFRHYQQMMVEEASSRYEDGNYLALSENYADIVRPKAKNDSSYLWLTNWLNEIVRRFEVSLTVTGLEENPVPESTVRLKGKAVYQSICKDFKRSSDLDDVISLPQSFGELVKVSKLDLSYCEDLTCLQKSISKFNNLLELNLCGYKRLTLPDSIGDLVKLSKLDLSYCKILTCLPKFIGKLSNLVELKLNKCIALKSLPDSIGGLVKLSKLDLSYCEDLKYLPESIGKLSNLVELKLNKCIALKSLPDSIGELVKLSKLDLFYCEDLKYLPESIGNLSNLLELKLDKCIALKSLPNSTGELVKLSKLDLSYCEDLKCLPESIGKLSNLLELNLSECKQIRRLPDTLLNLMQLGKLKLKR